MPTYIIPFTKSPSRQNPATFSADMDSRLSEENSRIIAMNAQSVENNLAVTSTSTAAANALAYSNNAATSAATATAAANRAQSVVIPTTAAYGIATQDWRDTMMSKAEFNAVAAERRSNRAGSGFDEFGKHSNAYPNVNDGIWTVPIALNTFSIGRGYTDAIGASKTNNPYTCVNGVVTNIFRINSSAVGSGYDHSVISLPPAPTVLPSTATLTQQQINSGVIKHADASNSGLIVNGKFDTDTSGWAAISATLSVVSNEMVVTPSINDGKAYQMISTIVGKQYVVEVNMTSADIYANIWVGTTSTGQNLGASTTGTGKKIITFTATTTTSYIIVHGGLLGSTVTVDNIAVFPADAISRSDLVFLESWHEDISEKDFVYPLGNVQYLGTTGDSGTPVAGAFAGAATYSLFSDTWQSDSALVGKGYVWSTLSDANKKAFVANPENNCYLDGDKVIQVRYRMRVVIGLGDSWQGYDSQHTLDAYGTMKYAEGSYIQAKGDLVSISSDYTLNRHYLGARSTAFITGTKLGDGMFALRTDFGAVASYTAGDCFALPIALVHRRNSGLTHPVYNPNGTKLASDSLPWHSTTVSFTSIADCFTESKLLGTSGYIGTTTGRADGIFYDQAHEGDITDLRVNSRGMNDYQRTSEKWFAKLQDATYRGTEGEKYTEAKVQTTTGTIATVEVNDGTKYKSGDTIYIYDLTASAVKGRFTVKSISTNTLIVDVAFAKLSNNYLISGASSTRIKSNTITMTDLIGSPANLPSSMKLDGQSFNTLHTSEDGTSLLPTGTTGSDGLAVYKLSRKANATPLQVLKSTDSGATWTSLTVTTHYTFSTTTNAITFTAGNIPLATHLIMVTYQTHTNMAVAAVNSEVLAIGDCYSTNSYYPTEFALLSTSLSGKVMTNGYVNPTTLNNGAISSYKLTPLNKLDNGSAYLPIHTNYSLAGATNYAYAVKVFPYLTRSNGKAYLQLVFKEMKYGSYVAPTVVTAASATYTQNMTYKINIAGCALDGKVIQWTAATTTVAVDWSLYDVSPTGVIYLLASGAVYANARLYDGDSWGDDSKFNIVDNVSVVTDTNGATVLIGQKRVELPYFIGAGE